MTTTYSVEPLQTYGWAKELRLKHFREEMTAKEQGKLLVYGHMGGPKELLAGIGDFVYMGGEPWAVGVVREGGQAMVEECLEEVERRGYRRDLCAYMRVSWGSMFLDKGPWGRFPKPDFLLADIGCDSVPKWYQVVAEYLGIPLFIFDFSFNGGDGRYTLNESELGHIVSQLEEFITWLEKTTGRRYNYDKLIETMANTYRTYCLWAEVCDLQGTIPAPLDYKLILPFVLAVERQAYEPETVALLMALRDEIKYRIAKGISPLPDERWRVLHEGLAPWYALYLFTYLRSRKVAVVGGSQQYHQAESSRPIHADGTLAPENPPNWAGIPKSRDEALRAKAMRIFFTLRMHNPSNRLMLLQAALTAWKGQGVIFMYDRGCMSTPLNQVEVMKAIQKQGTPAVRYETNRVDHREWSWSHVSDTMDSFLESLGVPKVAK